MKILVACEESQAVTKEFRRLGHEAYSNDIIDCTGGHPEWHIKKDVFEVINAGWDMMVCFPPCTHLAVSGGRWFKEKIADGRQQQGINFFLALANCNIPKIAIENPVGIMSTRFRKPDQIIRPFMFGDNSTKSTCLWLKNLPRLYATDIIVPETHTTKTGKTYDKWWFDTCRIADLKERASVRSKTFPGIARAMAEQWGNNGADQTRDYGDLFGFNI